MGPIKTSQFAEIWLAGEPLVEAPLLSPTEAELANLKQNTNIEAKFFKAGIVTSLRIQENLNSAQRNVIGTPVPIFMPGYYQATITAQKATLDLKSWKNIVNMNPFTAFRPDTYTNGTVANINVNNLLKDILGSAGTNLTNNTVPRFNFILFVRDTIASGTAAAPIEASTNIGIFTCMLQNYSVNITSTETIILEDITMIARPLNGSWFGAIQEFFETNPSFGYDPKLSSQKEPATPSGNSGSPGDSTPPSNQA